MNEAGQWSRLRAIRERRLERVRRAYTAMKKQRQARLEELDDIDARCLACRRAGQRAASDFLVAAEQQPVSQWQIEHSRGAQGECDDQIERLLKQRSRVSAALASTERQLAELARTYRDRQRETAALDEIVQPLDRDRARRAEAVWHGGSND